MFKFITIGMAMCAMTFGFSNASASELSKNDLLDGLQLSDSEKQDVDEFLLTIKNSGSFDLGKVLDAAHDGNPIALYIVGQCSLSGTGTAINRSVANQNFKMAASLGYSPALFEVFQMYANENHDPLLALVYLNLTISFGHKEYRDFYYEQTKLLAKVSGKRVIQEIEKIALDKTIKISKMQTEIQNRKNTYKPALVLLSKNITSDDRVYGEKYWKQFFESQESWEHFFGIDKDRKTNE